VKLGKRKGWGCFSIRWDRKPKVEIVQKKETVDFRDLMLGNLWWGSLKIGCAINWGERGRKLKSLEGDREVKKLKRSEKGIGSERERELETKRVREIVKKRDG
jgi:hypothetical protein